MATRREGDKPSSPNRSSNHTSQKLAQSNCSTTFGEYHQHHDEYSSIIGDLPTGIFFKEEHDKGERLAEIEYQACGELLDAYRELEHILQLKEYLFRRNKQSSGPDTQWGKGLPAI
ncbi:hypothetical protein ZIOFF_019511 [Zingiber officinale]|uniref:Uncharacterized protein n=1 Tax=Zingiber officinale TaxID=94328 RepID=A0A8J5HED2_ZINOF|nr:hypothetical protein ZIOFF_019511 [Zingiber officinale]